MSDPLEMMDHMTRSEEYDPAERYRDFRELFLGTDHGVRVLREIMSWGYVNTTMLPPVGPVDINRLTAEAGARRLALQIWNCCLRPPATRPPSQNVREKEK